MLILLDALAIMRGKNFREGELMKERRKEVILAAVQEETETALSMPEGGVQWSHAAALANVWEWIVLTSHAN